MRRAFFFGALLAGAFVFCLIANVHAGELDSLQSVIKSKCDSLYATDIGHELRKLPADSIPGYLSFMLRIPGADTMQIYKAAQQVQSIAALQRKIAHVKVKNNLMASWEGENEVAQHSHTVALIDHWFESSASSEPEVKPSGKLPLDIPDHSADMLKDILN